MPLIPAVWAPNPHIAFAWLIIGGTEVTTDGNKPRHLESFECSFQVEQIGNFEFVLYDPEEDFIEDLVATSKGECEFWFGYTTGLQSPHYEGIILEFTPEFLRDGIRITLRGMTKAFDMKKRTETRAWWDEKISDIVKDLAEKNGLKTSDESVQETKNLLFREDLDLTDLKHKTWQQVEADWDFMLNQLQKQAVRKSDGASGYMLWFEPDTKMLFFRPPDYERAVEGSPQFKWRDRLTGMISFSPNYAGTLLAVTAFGGSTQAAVVSATDATTQADNLQSKNKGDLPTSPMGEGTTTDGAANQTLEPASEDEFQPTEKMMRDWFDEFFAQNEAKFWWFRAAYVASFTGSMEIVGHPKLKPWRKYKITIEKAKGGNHWTSGDYWCSGITHRIISGQLTSTLALMRSDSKSAETSQSRLK